MAKIGEMLGFAGNPIYDTFSSNRQMLLGALSGAAQNPSNPWGGATQGVAQGAAADDAYATAQKEEAARQQSLNQTIEFMRSKGYDDLIAGVEGGGLDMGTAWSEALKRSAPGYGQENAPKPTSSIQEYEYALGQGYNGSFQEYETAMKQAGATNIDMNNTQALAGGYADRMAAANAILDDPKLTQAQLDMGQQTMSGIPGVGNFLTSGDRKLAEQAQRDFVNAILRRESGAAIAESEFSNASKQYFPQPGDTQEVIEQKRQNREIAIQGVSRAAGSNYQPPTLTPSGVVPYTDYFNQ